VRLQATKKRPNRRPIVRIGRPPRALAGEVDDRILETAQRVFLERGLAGASIDEIARLARAGKPTIYARFPTKEALFSAVVMRNAANVRARFESQVPAAGTMGQRLITVGANILQSLLVSEIIDFMRLGAAEARRFPELANLGRMARERGAHAVARVLSEVAQSGEIENLPAFAPERLAATAGFFMDLVVARLLMRAVFGENLKLLRAEIKTHVTNTVSFFLAACRHVGVN
jgi:AcrR family transcriptional regulator